MTLENSEDAIYFDNRSCPANFCDVEQKRDLDAICAQGGRRNVG